MSQAEIFALSEIQSSSNTVSFYLNNIVKNKLKEHAEKEHRSMSNMLELMILEYKDRDSIFVKQEGIKC